MLNNRYFFCLGLRSFLNLSKRNIYYLTNLDKFRAAYDFFYIRSQIDNDLKPYADKWFEIQKNVDNRNINKRKKYKKSGNKR